MPRPSTLVVVLLCALLSACTSSSTEQLDDGAFIAGRASEGISPADRVAAPAVSGETLDGSPLSLAELQGPVVVNFWASWCGPCIAEAPDLAETHERYRDRGVSVVGINVRDSRTNAQRFEAELDIPYPSLHDETGAVAAAFGGVGPGAVPSTIVLDAQHRVAVRMFGAVTFSQLAGHLDRLLAEADGDGTP